jgi:ABC-2 type transport system ATP-binding protein
MTNKIIEVENFTKKYGNFTAVDNISFTVDEGSVFAFLGPNGAGKSTTINTLCTIFGKTDGTLRIDGKCVSTQRDEVRSAIGVVFQDSTLDKKMTIEENLRMHSVFYDIPRNEVDGRIDLVLDLVELREWKKRTVGSLSGGMKRRVEIARGIMHYPRVLFLDEPTTGLDPQTRSHVWEYIVKLAREKNITVFLTTHYMDEAEICDKVAVMDHGRIIAHDTPYNLKRQYTKDTAYITTNNPDHTEDLLKAKKMEFEKKEGSYRIDADNVGRTLDILTELKENITGIEIRKGTLNDVFLRITGRDMRDEGCEK